MYNFMAIYIITGSLLIDEDGRGYIAISIKEKELLYY